MSRPRLRILLSEASSLSARHTIYGLGRAGHHIDLCDAKPFTCMGRFSRYVRGVFTCPSAARDPAGYVQFLQDRLREEVYDVLFPVHEQVYLLSRCQQLFAGRVGLPVPDFAALTQVQGKAEFSRLLDALQLQQPVTSICRTRQDLERSCTLPCYVKASHGTAGRGVFLVRDTTEREAALDVLEQRGLLNGQHEILLQKPVAGTLGVVQSVFRRGALLAAHCYLARSQGVGGSADARVGVHHPLVIEHLKRIGARLNWHGALALDYLWDDDSGPCYIDANPRIGETVNALLSGLNLPDLLARVATDNAPETQATPCAGKRTHNLLMRLLALGEQGVTRRRLLAELRRAWRGQGMYTQSEDEMTRPREDPPSVIPAAFVALRLMLGPQSARQIIDATVENYSLGAEAISKLEGVLGAGKSQSED